MSDSRYSAHAADPDEFVRIADVVKIFGDVVAVRSVNLSVKRNEIFALLGSSGSGKSTCCACWRASRKRPRARSCSTARTSPARRRTAGP